MNAQKAADKLIEISKHIAVEHDMETMLSLIVEGSMAIVDAEAATLYTVDKQNPALLRFSVLRNNRLSLSSKPESIPPLPLYKDNGQPSNLVAAQTFITRQTINIEDTYSSTDYDFSGTHRFDRQFGYRSQSFLSIPLQSFDGEGIGVLQLINALDETGKPRAFTSTCCRYIESLASMAATVLVRQQLIEGQKELFESFVTLIAKAIDLKSPVTSKHCQNVPAIAIMLAEAVQNWQEGPLANTHWNDDEMYELQVAAWLHDCGKLTTSELVIDKATKLQSHFDRIELIKSRFSCYRAQLKLAFYQSGQNDAESHQQQLAQLQHDLQFLEDINYGKEFMPDSEKQRVRDIAAIRWMDDEGHQHYLLSEDEAEHLCITRGTLTDEERNAMRGHMTATWDMLSALPYPTNLQNVADIAGNHHECLDGSGYPRGLSAESLSTRDRIMCIADIFEALTAPDRPYKKGLSLSESLSIMATMVKNHRLDAELFEIFIRSGTYKDYAAKHVAASQIDRCDEAAILAKAKQTH